MFNRNDRVRITVIGDQTGCCRSLGPSPTGTVVDIRTNPKGERQYYLTGAGFYRGPWHEDELELVFRLEDA
ncbi:MAG: hypothetical protein KA758_17670 [Acidimicrobiales bacterium]|nr:hypothetical protein [Acidimicrobiales bacterium]